MAESTAPDPVELWRDLLTQWERSVNDMSNKVMTSGEFSSSANQLTAVLLKVQESLGDLLDKYFRALNLPTRKDVERLDERMMAIEDLLHSMGGVLERLAHPSPAAVVAEHHLEHHHTEVVPEHVLHDAPVAIDAVASDLGNGSIGVEAVIVRKPKRAAQPAKPAVENATKTTKRPPRTKRPPAKKSSAT